MKPAPLLLTWLKIAVALGLFVVCYVGLLRILVALCTL